MLRIAMFEGRIGTSDATMWTPIANEETLGQRDAAEAMYAALCLFEAAKPWGGDERGSYLTSATEIAIREAA